MDVRILAICKFAFITLASAHWIGCIYMWIGAGVTMTCLLNGSSAQMQLVR